MSEPEDDKSTRLEPDEQGRRPSNNTTLLFDARGGELACGGGKWRGEGNGEKRAVAIDVMNFKVVSDITSTQ